MPKNRERVFAHGPLEIRVAEAGADLGPGPVTFISARMDVVRAGIMPMRMLVTPGQRRLDYETAALENAVVMRDEVAPNGESGRCCLHAGAHAFFVFGKGIEERGNEHVACHATERIEVDLHARRLWAAVTASKLFGTIRRRRPPRA
jgi:hypothetical protein